MLPGPVLVTGSSGHLGQALLRRLRQLGVNGVGMDPRPGPETALVASASDADQVRRALREHGVRAIVHAGALHKPQLTTHSRRAFLEQILLATQNLLEEATSPGSQVGRFVFTSTTSLMIDRRTKAALSRGAARAAWITEERAPLAPRNIYGVSKLAAEHLCRMHHELFGLPVAILRTARFFPEDDDQARRIAQDGLNTKANELLFRRASLADMVEAHLVALRHAPRLGFDRFIITAPSPFTLEDCEQLIRDAPAVVARHHPRFRELYARLGWTMFQRIDRVYVAKRAEERLGFRARTDFSRLLEAIERGDDLAALLGHDPGYREAPEVPPEL